jgi:hypothetical protein
LGTDLPPHVESHLRVAALAISDATDRLVELGGFSLDAEEGKLLLRAMQALAHAAEAFDLAVSDRELPQLAIAAAHRSRLRPPG